MSGPAENLAIGEPGPIVERKKTRKRRKRPTYEFPIEKAFAALLKLDEVIGEFPFSSFRGGTKMSRDFMRARGKLFDELMSNARQPGALARIAAINGRRKIAPPPVFSITHGDAPGRMDIKANIAQQASRITLTPETLISDVVMLDTFIAEQTMGRYFEPEVLGQKIRMVAIGPGEIESVRGAVSNPEKVLEFKGWLLKELDPETVADIFGGIVGFRGDVLIIQVTAGSPLIM